MKKLILVIGAICILIEVHAQSPDLFSYQAVVRDNLGKVISSKAVSLKFSILKTTATGTAQYVETHKPTTDANGLISIEIGAGVVSSGTFASIDWATDKYFLKVELDPAGGSSYSNMGTTQLISVPYAKHAETAIRVINDSVYDGDSSQTNELQTLSISNDTIFLSNGGFAVIPDSSLLGVKKGGGGLGSGGSSSLKEFDNDFISVARIGEGFSITSLETDKDKNVYIAGTFRGRITIGGQSFTAPNSNRNEVLIAKLDSNSNVQWAKATANVNLSRMGYIVDNNGNGYLILISSYGTNSFSFDGTTYNYQSGQTSGKVFKMNDSGSILWSTDYSGLTPGMLHLGLTNSSELLIASSFRSKLKIGRDSVQFVQHSATYGLLKLNTNGQSFTLLDSAINMFAQGVTCDPSGNIYTLIVSDYNQNGNVQLNGANLAIPNNTVLVKYSSAGNVLSTNNTFGAYNGTHSGNRNLIHNGTDLFLGFYDSDFTIGSDYYNGFHAYLLRLNSSLAIQSKATIEALNNVRPTSIGLKTNGSVAMSCYMENGYIIDDVRYTLVSGENSYASMYAEVSSSNKFTKNKTLQLFKQTDGVVLDATDNTAFIGCSVAGSFYNKGTKYTPGVYLFKE